MRTARRRDEAVACRVRRKATRRVSEPPIHSPGNYLFARSAARAREDHADRCGPAPARSSGDGHQRVMGGDQGRERTADARIVSRGAEWR